MPITLQLHHTGVSGMKNMFDKKVEKHIKTQLDNPFSEWEGAGQNKPNFSKEDESYGRPLPGSDSERRAQAAHYHIMMDIKYLCNMIWDCAEWQSPDGRAAITFGKLFNLYNAINDKVVGTLLRARKYGFLYFEGEMLYQKRDDEKVIELNRSINTIRARFGMPPLESNGGDVEKWGDVVEDPGDEDSENKDSSSFTSENDESKTESSSDSENGLCLSLSEEANDAQLNENETETNEQQNTFHLEGSIEGVSLPISSEIYGNGDSNFIMDLHHNAEVTNSSQEILPVQNRSRLSPLDINSTLKDPDNENPAEIAIVQTTFTTSQERALQADIISILGQFACNLTFLRSSKGSIDSEISNTATKIFNLLSTKVG